MELYTKKNIETFDEEIDNVIDKIDEMKLQILEPTKDTLMKINKIIINFIRENKRKIYGGYAQNKLVSVKNKDDAFYKETDIPDIDFYSPEPISDLINLSNILYKEGFKHVEGKEALHKETYSIFVDFTNVCDISYVPKNIYHRIPFIEINEIYYVHPSFIMIDMLRIITDPMFSSFRWKKIFPRVCVIQKHYPFNRAKDSLPNIGAKIPEDLAENVDKILNSVFSFIRNNNNIIMIGDYAYNYLLHESEIMKDKKIGSKYRLLNINKYEIVSTDYRADAEKLIENIKLQNPELVKDLNIVEYYPFWSLLGYSADILYKGIPLVYIIHYNRRCSPVKRLPLLKFENGEVKKDRSNGEINLGSYDYILLNNIVRATKERVNKKDKEYQYYNIMTSHLIEMRNYYLDKKNKNFLDDTIFQEFLATCIGETMDPLRETMLIRKKKFEEGKRPIYRYEPSDKDVSIPDYKFPNSSGNQIRNAHNFRIIEVGPIIGETRTRDRVEKEEEVEEEVPEDILKE